VIKNKLISLGLGISTLLMSYVIAPNVNASENNWKFSVGGTYSKPHLTKALQDINTIEDTVGAITTTKPEFEDWDDVPKGTIGFGLYNKKEFKIGNQKFTAWPGVYLAYAKGKIQTDATYDTVFAVPMDVSFKQEYEIMQLNFEFPVEFYKININKDYLKEINLIAAPVLTLSKLKSTTNLNTNLHDLASSRSVNGEFEDTVIGYAGYIASEFVIDNKWSLTTFARYDKFTFKGPTKTVDVEKTPGGTTTQIYNQHSEIDNSGPSFGLIANFKF
jgi:hypothetical protein